MTYRVHKARIELNCDDCNVARSQFDAETVGGCIREARDAGWMLRNSVNALTNQLAERERLTCKCPGCREQKARDGK